MNKKMMISGLLCAIVASHAMAGNFSLRQGDLLSSDKVDIALKMQSGNCPTQFPIESVDCKYSELKMGGVMAQNLEKLSSFATENIFQLTIALNAETLAKGYAFNPATCTNLQQKITTGSVIILNKTGCVVQ